MPEPIPFGVAPAQPQPRPAAECDSLAEIRAAIDTIDRTILAALRNRLDYVHAAGGFKRDAAEVRAQERVTAMLAERRAWAQQLDLDPDWVEQLYRFLVEGFIRLELQAVEKKEPGSGRI